VKGYNEVVSKNSAAVKRFITISILAALFVPSIAYAKRKAPPKVEPVTSEGVRYVVPNDDGRRAYVQAWDSKTGKMLWEVTVFRNLIIPLEEEDVQHICINKMSLVNGKLILVAEYNRKYFLELKARAVKRMEKASEK
jgi:hypothetical protein